MGLQIGFERIRPSILGIENIDRGAIHGRAIALESRKIIGGRSWEKYVYKGEIAKLGSRLTKYMSIRLMLGIIVKAYLDTDISP